jgi:NADPH-dependent F420 reductase
LKIGILGGTGDMGRGLGVRLALRHDILIGSRSQERASATALILNNYAKGFYQSAMNGSIKGVLNEDAVKESEAVIVSLPASVVAEYLKGFTSLFTPEKVVISTVVPMNRKQKLYYWTPLVGDSLTDMRSRSAAEVLQDIVKPAYVVSGFQTVPASYLYNIDSVLNIDVLLAGDDELSLAKTGSLVRDIPNLRPLRVGPLENSKFIESITPLLLNVAVLNDLHDPSIRIVPWVPMNDLL